MKNKIVLILFLIVLSSFGLTACDRSQRVEAARELESIYDREDILTDEEKDFATYTSEMHVGEIDMAKQAKQKSTNEDVRDYADSVIRAHSDALEDLSNNLGVQSNEPSWDTKFHMQFLAALTGAQFDQQFITLMIADHRSASDTFREEINVTQNRAMKNYLKQVLPVLEKGQHDGEEVLSKLAGQGTTN
jgi:putative membrane protein